MYCDTTTGPAVLDGFQTTRTAAPKTGFVQCTKIVHKYSGDRGDFVDGTISYNANILQLKLHFRIADAAYCKYE